jgi:hypothetical protein
MGGMEFYFLLRSLLSRLEVIRSFPLFFKLNSWIPSRFLLNLSEAINQYLPAILRRNESCLYAQKSVGKEYYYFFFLSGVRLSPIGTAATTGLLYQPQMIDVGDCGAIGGMNIGR